MGELSGMSGFRAIYAGERPVGFVMLSYDVPPGSTAWPEPVPTALARPMCRSVRECRLRSGCRARRETGRKDPPPRRAQVRGLAATVSWYFNSRSTLPSSATFHAETRRQSSSEKSSHRSEAIAA